MRITHRTASPISSENCGPRQMAQKRIAYGKLKARDGSSCGGCLTRTHAKAVDDPAEAERILPRLLLKIP